MALGRTSAFRKLDRPRDNPLASEGPLAPAPQDRAPRTTSTDVGQTVEKGLGWGRKGVEGLQRGFGSPDLGTFNRGGTETAYQTQRAGERDTSAYQAPTYTWPDMPADVSAAWQGYEPGPALGVSNPITAPINSEGLPIGDYASGAGVGGSFGEGGGGFGSIAGGAGAALGGLGGILGLINSIRSGNPMGTAGNLGSLYGTASSLFPDTFPSMTSMASGLFGGGAGAGGAGALAAGGAVPEEAAALGIGGAYGGGATAGGAAGTGLGAGLGGAAGAAGVLAMPLIFNSMIPLFGGESANIMDIFGGTADNPSDYQKFGHRLAFNEGQQGISLGALQNALPYVQSKEELGKLMNQYRNYTTSTAFGAPYSPPTDVYNLTTIPGMSGTEHGGKGSPVDWGPQTAYLQNIISAYKNRLPGNALTDFNVTPTGPDIVRLWQQFLNREGTAPKYSPGIEPSTQQLGEGSTADLPGAPKGPYFGGDVNSIPGLLDYGSPGYDYAATGWPEPGKYAGTQNPLYAQTMQSLMNPGGNTSNFNRMNIPSANPGATSNLLGSLGFAGLKGPQTELAGAENPNKL